MRKDYVNLKLEKHFESKQGKFKYQKLASLIKELNSNFYSNNRYSCAMLIRAIIDHVPPLLGYSSFESLVSQYPWPRSDKKLMEGLLGFKAEADKVLHDSISSKEDYFDIDDLPSSNKLNVLLSECARRNEEGALLSPSQDRSIKEPPIQFKVDKREGVRWASYAFRHNTWSCFRLVLEIDNFKNSSPDFVSVKLEAKNGDDGWEASYFSFQYPDETIKQNISYKIEARDIKTVGVFMSTNPYGDTTSKPMPDFDRDTLKLIVTTRGGATATIPIKPGLISNG